MHIGVSEDGDCGVELMELWECIAERLELVFEIMFLFILAHFLKLIMSVTAESRVVLVHGWPTVRIIINSKHRTHSFIHGR